MPHIATNMDDGKGRDIYSFLMSVSSSECKVTWSCYVECQYLVVQNKPAQMIPNSRKLASDLGVRNRLETFVVVGRCGSDCRVSTPRSLSTKCHPLLSPFTRCMFVQVSKVVEVVCDGFSTSKSRHTCK